MYGCESLDCCVPLKNMLVCCAAHFFSHESWLSCRRAQMKTNNSLLVDDRHLMTEWGKRESVRSIILVSWFLCFGVIIACKGGNINPSSTVKVSALHWVSVQASMFFLFFSNKNTLLALCFAMKLTLSHCAYDSQRESVSSHSSLSPAVDPWWTYPSPFLYHKGGRFGVPSPISLLFLSTPQGRGVCLLPLPMSLRTAKGEGSRSIFFLHFYSSCCSEPIFMQ